MTTITNRFLSSPNFICPAKKIKVAVNNNILLCPSSCNPSPSIQYYYSWSINKRKFGRRPTMAGGYSQSQSYADYLASEFASPGVAFSGIGDGCIVVVKIALENGSTATLMLPNGLITSFKAQMWHGGTTELLHTIVSQREEENGGAVIQGGLSLAICCENVDDDRLKSWSPDAWVLHQVKGTPQESIQVELMSRNAEGDAQVKHLITLEQDVLTSEILVSNSSSTSFLRLVGSVLSHLVVSTPDATYAVGLEGSDFTVNSPLVGNFSILPLPPHKQRDTTFLALNISKWFPRNQNIAHIDLTEGGIREGEEEDNYKHLTKKLSRIYTSAPQSFTIIDRGRRNSVAVRRHGFNELYIFSPGSEREWYSKYSYICVGHAALLEPIILKPKSEWRGGLQLQNPNS